MVDTVTRSLFMADTATTDTSQHMAMIPTVIKSQLMVGTTNTSRPMAKNPMVTKSPLTADTITTDTSRPMATILTDTKNPTERSTIPATLIIPSKKSVNMLMLKKT